MLSLPAAGTAFPNQPDGFGEAKFGASPSRVREIFPELKELAVAPKEPLAFYTAEGLSFEGLNPCKVTFSFVTDALYELRFDCGHDDRVRATLYEKFGQPSAEEEKLAIWRGQEAVVSMNRQMKTFAISNPGLKQRVTQYLLQRALTTQGVDLEKGQPEKPSD